MKLKKAENQGMQNAKTWDKMARAWQKGIRRFYPSRDLYEKVLNLLLQFNVKHFEDYGTGTGILQEYLLRIKWLNENRTCLGLDYSEAMIRLAEQEMPQLNWVQNDMLEHLEIRIEEQKDKLSSEWLEMIVAINSIDKLPRKRQAQCVQLAYQALKPGGIIVASAVTSLDPLKMIQLHLNMQASHRTWPRPISLVSGIFLGLWYDFRNMLDILDMLKEVHKHARATQPSSHTEPPVSGDEFRSLFTKAGFTIIEAGPFYGNSDRFAGPDTNNPVESPGYLVVAQKPIQQIAHP